MTWKGLLTVLSAPGNTVPLPPPITPDPPEVLFMHHIGTIDITAEMLGNFLYDIQKDATKSYQIYSF